VSLRLSGVSYRYAGSPTLVLTELDLAVEPGEVVAIVGANESGKSTLCLVAAGLAPATIAGRLDGTVGIDDLATATARPYELAQRCGSLFQNPGTQLSGTTLTVWEEIAFGPRNLGLPVDEVVVRVEAAVEVLGIGDLIERSPAHLSGGQAQLVALAGVLALRPGYLVLDEPTSQLDPQGTRLVGDALTALAVHSNVGILIVEHKTDLVARIATRVGVIDAGRLATIGPTVDVLASGRLIDWGVEPPSDIRLGRAAAEAGVSLG
jgi:energy-coupling factor transporter ATP-binding protein EcfA2